MFSFLFNIGAEFQKFKLIAFSPHVSLCIVLLFLSVLCFSISLGITYSILQAAPHLSSVHHTTLSRKFSSNSGFEPSPAWVFYSPDNRGDDRSGAPASISDGSNYILLPLATSCHCYKSWQLCLN